MATMMTRDELIQTCKDFRLPGSGDAWREAGKPMPDRDGWAPLVSVQEGGEVKLGTIVYVTSDGWAGVVLEGETRCDEWPAERLSVD